jgi:hypothetical protein
MSQTTLRVKSPSRRRGDRGDHGRGAGAGPAEAADHVVSAGDLAGDRDDADDASYCGVLARLAGLLADIPFALEWHVPTKKVVTDWRVLVPADLMEALFWRAADRSSATMIRRRCCWPG